MLGTGGVSSSSRMERPALRVIQDQLPEGVRDLAISVTTSEREGMKQVEKAIGLMPWGSQHDRHEPSRSEDYSRLESKILRTRIVSLKSMDDLQDCDPTPFADTCSTELPFEAAKRVIRG